MSAIDCSLECCKYVVPVVDAAVAASLLVIYSNVVLSANAGCCKQKPPKIDRPNIGRGCNKEIWNIFCKNTELSGPEKLRQLYRSR